MHMFEKNNSGFTLIEILVVLAIIGLLSTLTMAAVNMARGKAKVAKALNDIDTLNTALEMLATDTGQWPGHQQVYVIGTATPNNEYCGVDAATNDCASRTLGDDSAGLVSNDGTTPFTNWQGPYIKEAPLDAWGHEYFFDTDYQVDAAGLPTGCGGVGGPIDVVVIGSYGPDGLGIPVASYSCDDIIKIILQP